ncbi:iron-sulfur cluster-binding domain-containing protein [Aestuariibacter sp. AA17]|uniref:Iron-sulfur cluster-binding domain-containing protein n=1 Tax=Fluctibacter corallii TaxID=2984329 RepID=A0ABT3A8J2_9ALTE|nr:iron-sulfur cluster-binding domain-containing protein [Aestuariibacter sp. AA17]MCV2884602.1 iron-sulfur cluster-binding domain-containing protein [Aestuariibacter sp. AA17]
MEENIFRCIQVRNDVEGMKTFVFKPAKTMRFLPGQFVSFDLPTPQGTITRSYSCSSSTCNDNISFSVRQVENGRGSNWLHENLNVGDELSCTGPYGFFTPDEHATDKLLFLAAGSGITPFLSVLRTWRDLAKSVDALLVFSVRSPTQIIEYAELKALAAQIPGFSFIVLPEVDPDNSWTGITGRLDGALMDVIVRDLPQRRVYTCGPKPYMDNIKQHLLDKGIGLDRFHEEAFVSPKSEKPVEVVASGAEYRVQFEDSGIEVSADGSSTLLELAEKAGITVRSACRTGICGSCQVQKKAGDVDMNDLGGILPSDKENGMILLCCSRPKSDVVLSL